MRIDSWPKLTGLVMVLAWVHAPAPVRAETTTSAATLLSAVVEVRARVPASARTAGSLGTERTGSGTVIDGGGLVVTIGYLVLEADRVEVVAAGAPPVAADVLAYDHDTGLGLLRARTSLAAVPLPLGDSSTVAKLDGLLVASYGGPGAARPAVLVARREFAGYWEYLLDDALFTVPPHPLFGGAALIDEGGELVGIGSLAVGDASRGARPMPGNMFVPVNRLKQVLGDLLSEGRSSGPRRPWLGLYPDDSLGPVVVRRLAAEGPAEAAGVLVGDVVMGVGEVPVTSMADFYRTLWSMGGPGSELTLTLLRDSRMIEVLVTAGDRYDWLRLPARP